MKRIVLRTGLFLGIILATHPTWGQTQTPPPPPGSVISSPRSQPQAAQPGSGLLSFTNPAGGSFSVEQMDSQLRNLQTAVEQTLPILTSFNNQFGANSGGALGGVLSRVFPGSRSSNPAPTQGTGTNWLSALGRLLGATNNPTAGGLDRTTLDHLASLQKDLQSVAQGLQSLNLGNPATNGATGIYGSSGSAGTNQFDRSTSRNTGLTPTGR